MGSCPPISTAFTCNAVGQIDQVTLPNSVVLTYDYDDAKRLTRITNAAGEKIEYAYDAMGNRTLFRIVGYHMNRALIIASDVARLEMSGAPRLALGVVRASS